MRWLLNLFGFGRVVDLFSAILHFLASPQGMLIIFAIIFVVGRWDARRDGFKEAKAQCQTAAVLAENEELRRRAAASAKVAADNEAALKEEQEAHDELAKVFEEFQLNLDAGDDNCPPLTSDDIKRLR